MGGPRLLGGLGGGRAGGWGPPCLRLGVREAAASPSLSAQPPCGFWGVWVRGPAVVPPVGVAEGHGLLKNVCVRWGRGSCSLLSLKGPREATRHGWGGGFVP